jgi:hypothetical protein
VFFGFCWCYEINEVTRVSDETIKKHLRSTGENYKTYTARPSHPRQMSACVLLVYWLVLAYCVAGIFMKLIAFLIQPTYNDSQQQTVSKLLWDNLQLDHLEKYIVFILFGLVCIINWNAESHSEYLVTETQEASGNQQTSVAEISSETALLIFRDVAVVEHASVAAVENDDVANVELDNQIAARHTNERAQQSNNQSNPASNLSQSSTPNVFDTVTQDSMVELMKVAVECRPTVFASEGFLALKVFANAKAENNFSPSDADKFRKLHVTLCLNHPRAYLRDQGRSKSESPLLKRCQNHCEIIQAYVFLTLMLVFEKVLIQPDINDDTKEKYVKTMTSIVQSTVFILTNPSNVARLHFLNANEKKQQHALNVLCALWGHVFQCNSEDVLVVLKLSLVKDKIKAAHQAAMVNFPTTPKMETYVGAMKQWMQRNADESEEKIVQGLLNGKTSAPIMVWGKEDFVEVPMYDTTLPATSGGTGLLPAAQGGRG